MLHQFWVYSRVIQLYIHIYILFHYRLSQDSKFSSLCYLVGPYCLLKECFLLTCMHAKSPQSCLTLFNLMDHSLKSPLSMGFSRQEYWSELPCPPPGALPDPEIEPASLMSPALAARFFTTSSAWEAHTHSLCSRSDQQRFLHGPSEIVHGSSFKS